MAMATATLVNIIYEFCLAYSNVALFDYQAQFAKRIIRSVIEGDGAEITALFSRQSGKSETVSVISGGLIVILPILANMPMFASDKRLMKFKNGFLVGVFAPSLNQSQIIFGRTKKRLGNQHSLAVLADPEIQISFDVANGQNFLLSNGSLLRCQSASDGANIEGDSYMLILCDESQDIGNFKYLKSIGPMGAFYNATRVLIGTTNRHKGFFYSSIQRNKDAQEKGGRRDHFEYDCDVVMKYNPDYAKYIAGEKKKLGESSDEFQMSYKLKWILKRGMFITSENWDKLLDNEREFGESEVVDTTETIAGLDLGKSMDSTILAFGDADFSRPILVEASDKNTEEDYTAYQVDLTDLVEFQGDDWDEQYYMILEECAKRPRLKKLVIDATGVGSPIVDRIRANTSYEIVPYVYSTPSKSDLYKHFDAECKAGRFRIPAGPESRNSVIYTKMERQFLDLEKNYRGQHLVVAHPDETGAHDDIPDACALLCWGAKTPPDAAADVHKGNLLTRMRAGSRMKSDSRCNIKARRK